MFLGASEDVVSDDEPVDEFEEQARELEVVAAQVMGNLAYLDFSQFVQQAWPTIEPATRLQWGRHHQLICDVLQSLVEDWLRTKSEPGYINAVRNALFGLPPGSLKSKLIGVCLHPWLWLHDAGAKIICLSVNEDATMRDARLSRDLIRSPWYQNTFAPEWRLKGDQDAISNYGNTAGGERLSKPSGSEIVGLRSDFLLYDDPNNPLEAENANERGKVNALWDTNIYNRVNDPLRSVRIGVQQRTHVEDWTGHVLKQQGAWSPTNPEGWLCVVMPAEYSSARRFAVPSELAAMSPAWAVTGAEHADWRTVEGESIDPVRMPVTWLADERKRWSGTHNYAAQMLQLPVAAEGGAILRQWWSFCRLEVGVRSNVDVMRGDRPRPAGCRELADAPNYLVRAAHMRPGHWDLDWIHISVDAAAKRTERGSNWGILVTAGKQARRFVLDDRTQRGDILEILVVLRELVRLWQPDKILIEDKAAGPSLISMLRDEMARGDLPLVVVEIVQPGTQGKEERLDSCKPTLATGNVYLLEGAPWLEAFIEEMSSFPAGQNDDRVDALSQVLNYQAFASDDFASWPSFS